MDAVNAELPTCPTCSYILVGLDDPRCPECGRAFAWGSPELFMSKRPAIEFERARGWRRIPAFFATCFSVLVTPWVFARQIVSRTDGAHATAFALACFATTVVSFAFGCDLPFFVAWIVTAMIYIVAQALILFLLDTPSWTRPRQALLFWLCVGCYTSAIMVTEIVNGPPYLMWSGIVEWFVSALLCIRTGDFSDSSLFFKVPWRTDTQTTIYFFQMIIWLAGLACCVYVRIRSTNRSAFSAAWRAAAAVVCLLLLYSLGVEFVGGNIYEWLD